MNYPLKDPVRLNAGTQPLWQRALTILLLIFLTVCQTKLQATPLGLDVSDKSIAEQGWTWLAPHGRYLEDRNPLQSTSFQILEHENRPWIGREDSILNLGYGTEAWWIHIPLHNTSDQTVQRIVEIAEPCYDDLKIWHIQGHNILAQAHMGDQVPFASRPINYRHPAITLEIPPGIHTDLLILATALDKEHDPLPIRLWKPQAFYAHTVDDALIYGLYFGAGATLWLISLLLYFNLREHVYAWYAAYLGSFLCWNFTYRGFSFQYLWPDLPAWNFLATFLFVVGIYIGMPMFSNALLNIKYQSPRIYQIVRLMLLLTLLHIPVMVVAPETGVFATLNLIGLVIAVLLFAAAWPQAASGNFIAKIYLAGITCILAGGLPYNLIALNLMTPSLWTIHAFNIGSALEFTLLALALAFQINQLRIRKMAAEQQAFDALNRSAQALEEKVRERTQELEIANQHLQEMAQRDRMTNLYNRGHFNEYIKCELAKGHRLGTSLALLVLDLDYFKRLNDLSGHLAGDAALVRVARYLLDHARRSTDLAFRLGGEEFALTSLNIDADHLQAWAEEIRAGIEHLSYPHPGQTSGILTASIGATLSIPRDDLESLYYRADQALYAAKYQGRNKVILQLG